MLSLHPNSAPTMKPHYRTHILIWVIQQLNKIVNIGLLVRNYEGANIERYDRIIASITNGA